MDQHLETSPLQAHRPLDWRNAVSAVAVTPNLLCCLEHESGNTALQVLLFSTMTRVLDVLEDYLDWRGYEHLRLDGSVSSSDRGELVKRFNAPGKFAVLWKASQCLCRDRRPYAALLRGSNLNCKIALLPRMSVLSNDMP